MFSSAHTNIPDGFRPSSHIKRAYANSECRVAIVVALEDGDPMLSVASLARESGSAIWTIDVKDEKSEQNAIDYIDVGLNNGDWVYLKDMEMASQDLLRKIAIALSTLKPDPKHYPRRENFRLWLIYRKHIGLDENVSPAMPQLLSQHSIVAHCNSPTSPNKWVKRTPQEPSLYEFEMDKHKKRRDVGRQSDSESDDEPGQKVVGKWFSRAVEFHHADNGSTVRRLNEEIFRLILDDDLSGILEICKENQINIQKLKHVPSGMTPLQFAVSNEKVQAAKLLLDFSANPNEPRDSDGCPPLFMSIESLPLVELLIERGAQIDTKFEGFLLEKHPSTSIEVAKFIKELKGY